MEKIKSDSFNFSNLGIAPKILDILQKWGFNQPTLIQSKSIPLAIKGNDLVGIAQTGTGKTLAFGIPMIQRLSQIGGRGLLLLPTRELASQANMHLKNIGARFGLRTAVLIGGEPKNIQLRTLRQKPRIIIATPGRLIDHIKSHSINLSDIKILVLDEADMMFDIGFAPQINEILKSVPRERQTMLFSATMPPAIMSLVAKHMKLPINIEVAPSGTPAENINQEMVIISKEKRVAQLEKILTSYHGSVLIFCRTKHGVRKLTIKIRQMGHTAAEIHSNRSLSQRSNALRAFKNGGVRVLVATDIAARGIDVKGIELVLNFDLPENAGDYVHRIGRTGRAGNAGQAISFVSPTEMREVKKIERIIKKTIPLTKLAEPEYDSYASKQGNQNKKRFNNYNQNNNLKRSPRGRQWNKRGRSQKFARNKKFNLQARDLPKGDKNNRRKNH
ncbi:DEAD/DEAH box helicase [Patescibacteria group bacterium]|nr:DEAD/DEAH box helicase [Patescibacteria group bacterium]MBU4511665.1 DEAD/DEAH box helicase [Patescibacteria group bacterium]